MYNQEHFGGFGHMGGMMGGGYMFLIFLFIAALVIFALFKATSKCTPKTKEDDALEILKKRFANGEISEEEYRSKSKIIKG